MEKFIKTLLVLCLSWSAMSADTSSGYVNDQSADVSPEKYIKHKNTKTQKTCIPYNSHNLCLYNEITFEKIKSDNKHLEMIVNSTADKVVETMIETKKSLSDISGEEIDRDANYQFSYYITIDKVTPREFIFSVGYEREFGRYVHGVEEYTFSTKTSKQTGGEYLNLNTNNAKMEMKPSGEPIERTKIDNEEIEEGCDDAVYNQPDGIIPLENNAVSMKIHYIIHGDWVRFSVSAVNKLGNGKGGVTLSFPTLNDKSSIVNLHRGDFDTVKAYPAGSGLWSGKYHRKIRSDYPMVEGWAPRWHRGETKNFSFTVNIGKGGMRVLRAQMRAVVLKNGRENVLPVSGVTEDQQGYQVHRVLIDFPQQTNVGHIPLEQVLTRWNVALNEKNYNAMKELYAKSLTYYRKKYPRTEVINDKRKALTRYPDFVQRVEDVIMKKINESLYKIIFDKYSRLSSSKREKKYPAYLFVEKFDGDWKIVEEGDLVTDGRILKEQSISSLDIPIKIDVGNEDEKGCDGEMIYGIKNHGDGFVAVRSGPGMQYEIIDKLKHNGILVQGCDMRGKWVGILYDGENCLGRYEHLTGYENKYNQYEKVDYNGPCKSGWVFYKYTKVIAD